MDCHSESMAVIHSAFETGIPCIAVPLRDGRIELKIPTLAHAVSHHEWFPLNFDTAAANQSILPAAFLIAVVTVHFLFLSSEQSKSGKISNNIDIQHQTTQQKLN